MLYVCKLFLIERCYVPAFECPQRNMALTGEPSETHKHKFPGTFQCLDELILSGAFLVIKVIPNLSGNDSDFHDHRGRLLFKHYFTQSRDALLMTSMCYGTPIPQSLEEKVATLPGEKLIGLRREVLIGECVWDLFPAATDTQFDKCFRQAVATNQTITFEEYYPAPIDKWLACRCYPSADGLAVYFHDITIRKQAEESLRKANELLRLAVVVRDSSDAVTVQDLEGRILAWNPGAEKLYGWSEAEALALNIRDRTPVALQAEALERVKQLSRARILEPYLTKRLTKSGSVLAVSMISTALVDPAGQMYAIATTERVQKAGEK